MQIQVSLTIEIGASASLAEIEQQVQEIGQQAMRAAFKQTIRQWEEQQQTCLHCGAKQRRLEGTVRRVIAAHFGRVQVPRRRFGWLKCGRRCCPANALFAELNGSTVSRPLQEAALLAGCSWPYRAASATLKRLCGAQISAEEIRLLLNRQGKLRAAQQQAEASRVCAEPTQPPAAQQEEERVLVGIDGGWAGSREQRGGMEGKVAVVCAQVLDLPMPQHSSTFSWSQRAPRHPPRQRHRPLKRRYVATFGPSAQLGTLAEAAARSVSEQVRRPLVLLADGAQWIKTQQARHFPQATCILDWAHLWREVRHAIRVAARATPLTQRQRDYQLYLHRTGCGTVRWIKHSKACAPWLTGCLPRRARPSPRP